jgi:hypothetical protein
VGRLRGCHDLEQFHEAIVVGRAGCGGIGGGPRLRFGRGLVGVGRGCVRVVAAGSLRGCGLQVLDPLAEDLLDVGEGLRVLRGVAKGLQPLVLLVGQRTVLDQSGRQVAGLQQPDHGAEDVEARVLADVLRKVLVGRRAWERSGGSRRWIASFGSLGGHVEIKKAEHTHVSHTNHVAVVG